MVVYVVGDYLEFCFGGVEIGVFVDFVDYVDVVVVG